LAGTAYNEALKLEPQNPNFYLKLGQLKSSEAANKTTADEKKQMIGEAKDLFQKAIDQKKNFDAGYYYMSLAQEALGDLDGAIENAKTAFSIDSSSINYAFNLARLYQARGKDDDNKIAESIFKQILGVNDKEINTHFSLAILYEKTKKNKEAIDEYNRVLELLPPEQKDARTRIEKMISNLKNGIENTPQNLGDTVSQQQPAAAQPPVDTQQPAQSQPTQ
jgi:cytochrome c-type biogenesis protein CcmH/NrfG